MAPTQQKKFRNFRRNIISTNVLMNTNLLINTKIKTAVISRLVPINKLADRFSQTTGMRAK